MKINMQKKINVITLGCAKNIVDSEHMMGQLRAQGWVVEFDKEDSMARTVIINTCGFILDAKEESIEMILAYAQAKAARRIDHLFVMGCLSQRYREELRTEISEVDQFYGVNNIEDVIRRITESEEAVRDETLRMLTTPSHYAYLKISEGCNWGCGYCAIPLIRGKHKSVPMENLLAEARALAAAGVKELIVIAQDTTYYGMDLYGERRLGTLLRELCRIDGLEWVRLHYAYPAQFPQDVIDAIRDEAKICKYLDIPFQHISDAMLASMRRGLDKEQTMELVAKLRREVPGIALRTTLLVGYPGETQQDFEELLQFVRDASFERLGVFPYSEEEGTYSALSFTDDVDDQTKEYRAQKVITLQQDYALAANERLVGTTQRVIVDRREGDYLLARTEFDSPEVDNEVLIKTAQKIENGTMLNVEITSADSYEIYGKIV